MTHLLELFLKSPKIQYFGRHFRPTFIIVRVFKWYQNNNSWWSDGGVAFDFGQKTAIYKL